MKAVIHIGTPKSGTTTIQSFLMLNRSALISQGFRYEPFDTRNVAQMELGLTGMVEAGETVDTAIKQWALGAYESADQEAYVARFDAMLAEGVRSWPEHTYIASSEQIFAWLSTPKRIRALDAFLHKHFESVHYIVYFRPQHELMLSSYSERIKRGEILTFEEHFTERLNRMNWNRRARMWTEAVGRENFTVRLLDRERMANGDLLDDFCAVAGLDRSRLDTPPRMNLSLTTEEIALYLKLGRFLSARTRKGGRNMLFFGLLKVLGKRLPKPGTRLRLTDAQLEQIRTTHAGPNERLRAAFFPEYDTLFSSL
ncbi:MAG: hypothetical protein H6898_17075 [Rhodobacter sp.]|nr:hypothetical protein [Paracoccaceae bacterium]MCC0078270.1 hypothetical protein [Rhodobacter sp.]